MGENHLREGIGRKKGREGRKGKEKEKGKREGFLQINKNNSWIECQRWKYLNLIYALS